MMNATSSVWQMTMMGLRYLNGRRLRTALTTLAIVFGVALIFAINLVLPSATRAFQQTMTSVTGADISLTSVSGESFDPNGVLERIAGVQGVKAVSGVLRRQFSVPTFENGLGSVAQIELIGLDPATIQDVHQFVMSEGEFLQPDDTGKVLIPAGLAELAPDLKLGTTFPLITAGGLKIYSVTGILAEQSGATPQFYVTLADAQAAFNQPGLMNTAEVAVIPGADPAAVGAAILQVLGAGFQLSASSDATSTFAAMQIGFAMFDLFGLLALFLGAFLIFNTFRTVVIERRHDIGMLRAVGATRRQITTMIVIESLIQGGLGTLIGLALGYALAALMVNFMGQFWETYLHRGSLQLQLNVSAVIAAGALGLITALAAGYWPARRAGQTSPLEALRPAAAASVQRAARWSLIVGVAIMALSILMLLSGSRGAVGGALLFLVGMVIAAPGLVIPISRLFSPLLTLWFAREGDLARGNLIRQPGRAAITGSTLMIGLATLVLIAATVSALNELIVNLAERNFSSDVLLMPQSISIYDNVIGADESLANRLRALPEVEGIGTLRYAKGLSGGQSLQIMGIDPLEYPKVASFEFAPSPSNGEGGAGETVEQAAFAALGSGQNAIVTSLALRTLGKNVGDDLVIETAEGPQTYHISAIANDLLTFKIAAIFISQANLAADFHKTEDIMLMLNLTPDADKTAAMADVEAIVADYPQFTPHLTGEYRDEMMNYSTSAMGLFYGLAVLILIPAALGLLNTLTINILERTREIGVVRAVGGSRGQVRRMVMGEALLLGIFGAAMGVLAGVAMSYGFIAAFATVGWTLPYIFPAAGIIAAIVIGIVLALFASILPARSAAKLDIIRALQYE
jgi:putative ABC transport system permease protein